MMGLFVLVVPIVTVAGKISEEKKEQLIQDFNRYDLNRDGRIDPQEIRTLYGQQLSQDELQSFFNAVDKLQQGTFDLDDYIQYALSLAD
jgi:Ca2+-binding EF-hand superfamily protein